MTDKTEGPISQLRTAAESGITNLRDGLKENLTDKLSRNHMDKPKAFSGEQSVVFSDRERDRAHMGDLSAVNKCNMVKELNSLEQRGKDLKEDLARINRVASEIVLEEDRQVSDVGKIITGIKTALEDEKEDFTLEGKEKIKVKDKIIEKLRRAEKLGAKKLERKESLISGIPVKELERSELTEKLNNKKQEKVRLERLGYHNGSEGVVDVLFEEVRGFSNELTVESFKEQDLAKIIELEESHLNEKEYEVMLLQLDKIKSLAIEYHKSHKDEEKEEVLLLLKDEIEEWEELAENCNKDIDSVKSIQDFLSKLSRELKDSKYDPSLIDSINKEIVKVEQEVDGLDKKIQAAKTKLEKIKSFEQKANSEINDFIKKLEENGVCDFALMSGENKKIIERVVEDLEVIEKKHRKSLSEALEGGNDNIEITGDGVKIKSEKKDEIIAAYEKIERIKKFVYSSKEFLGVTNFSFDGLSPEEIISEALERLRKVEYLKEVVDSLEIKDINKLIQRFKASDNDTGKLQELVLEICHKGVKSILSNEEKVVKSLCASVGIELLVKEDFARAPNVIEFVKKIQGENKKKLTKQNGTIINLPSTLDVRSIDPKEKIELDRNYEELAEKRSLLEDDPDSYYHNIKDSWDYQKVKKDFRTERDVDIAFKFSKKLPGSNKIASMELRVSSNYLNKSKREKLLEFEKRLDKANTEREINEIYKDLFLYAAKPENKMLDYAIIKNVKLHGIKEVSVSMNYCRFENCELNAKFGRQTSAIGVTFKDTNIVNFEMYGCWVGMRLLGEVRFKGGLMNGDYRDTIIEDIHKIYFEKGPYSTGFHMSQGRGIHRTTDFRNYWHDQSLVDGIVRSVTELQMPRATWDLIKLVAGGSWRVDARGAKFGVLKKKEDEEKEEDTNEEKSDFSRLFEINENSPKIIKKHTIGLIWDDSTDFGSEKANSIMSEIGVEVDLAYWNTASCRMHEVQDSTIIPSWMSEDGIFQVENTCPLRNLWTVVTWKDSEHLTVSFAEKDIFGNMRKIDQTIDIDIEEYDFLLGGLRLCEMAYAIAEYERKMKGSHGGNVTQNEQIVGTLRRMIRSRRIKKNKYYSDRLKNPNTKDIDFWRQNYEEERAA